MDKETRRVPQALRGLMIDYTAIIKCRDKCIASIFKAKRAIYYAKKAERIRLKFWGEIRELYPETKQGEWHYNSGDERILPGKAK